MENRLNIKVSFYGDTIGIINISGDLNSLTEDSELFFREVKAYIKMGIYRYILDLNNLTYIDSSGISIIMQLISNSLKNKSSICVMCNVPHILRILTISNIDKFVHFVTSIEEGIDYYQLNNNGLQFGN